MNAMKSIATFKGECKLEVWLCQIAKHTYFAWRKKQKRFQAQEERLFVEAFEDPEARETAMDIYRALHKLEDPYKEVFTLRTFGELSFAQIAELFAKTENWARVTYHRAKIKIRERMEVG